MPPYQAAYYPYYYTLPQASATTSSLPTASIYTTENYPGDLTYQEPTVEFQNEKDWNNVIGIELNTMTMQRLTMQRLIICN